MWIQSGVFRKVSSQVCAFTNTYFMQGVFSQVQVMADFEHRFAATVSRYSNQDDRKNVANINASLITQRRKVFLPAFWVRSGIDQGSFVIGQLMTRTRTWCDDRSFEQQSPCRQILQRGESFYSGASNPGSNLEQRSISAWCIVFMLGVALQVGATYNVAYIYCKWSIGQSGLP